MLTKSLDSCSKPHKSSAKCMLLCMTLIFFTCLTTFTLLEVRHLNADEPSVVRIIMNSFKSSEEREFAEKSPNKFVLVNVEKQQDTEELLKTIITQEEAKAIETERKVRETKEDEDKSSLKTKNSYYEEQTPIVVYSKSEPEIPYSYRHPVYVPPKEDSNEEKPFSDASDSNEQKEDGPESRQNPYYDNSEEQGYQNDEPYYRPNSEEQEQQQQNQQQPQEYYGGYENSREEYPYPNGGSQQESEEGRSSQQSNYDSYYRNWHYATPAPKISSANGQENRKLQAMTSANKKNRDPYAAYMDDYDYMPPHSSAGSQQMQQYHTAPSPSQALEKPEDQGHEMNLLSILKTLKTMWDLYQSFASSWNTMAQRRNKEEELAKQKYRQQMKLKAEANKQQQQQQNNNNKKNQPRPTKNPKKQQTTPSTTTTTTTATAISGSGEMYSSEDEAEEVPQVPAETTKVEPRKGSKGDKTNTKNVEGLREKRQTSDNKEVTESTDVAEGRYIKGDPLKGYYDFVITEGSYKFWAVFQVGTALLIIYSTFAAIYYSKVNPLVSDYDYTDYLGGARSLSGGDLDFVDDETPGGSEHSVSQPKSWMDWLPRTGHSLKFILDAIDKLPADQIDNAATRSNDDGDDEAETDKAM